MRRRKAITENEEKRNRISWFKYFYWHMNTTYENIYENDDVRCILAIVIVFVVLEPQMNVAVNVIGEYKEAMATLIDISLARFKRMRIRNDKSTYFPCAVSFLPCEHLLSFKCLIPIQLICFNVCVCVCTFVHHLLTMHFLRSLC